jgi:hypothetical protein
VSRWKKEAQENGQRAFPGQGHPQAKGTRRMWNYSGCAARLKSCAQSGRY